jgi:hypothetical protein
MSAPWWIETPAWVEATKKLRNDPNASVPCPSCGKGNLQIVDMPQAAPDDTYLCCPQCAEFNFFLFGPWDNEENEEKAFQVWTRLLGEGLKRSEAEAAAQPSAERPEQAEVFKKWLEAVNVLRADPRASVACPRCGKGSLEVFDSGPEGAPIERHMRCRQCGAYKALLFARR